MSNKIDILTIGDSCIDQLMRIDDGSAQEESIGGSREICFIHGTKIPVQTFEISIAGNAVNVAVGTSRLGLKTYVYSEIGDDMNADKVISELKAHGVNTNYCIRNKGTLTDIHPIIVYGNDRTIFIYHAPRQYKVQKWPVPKWLYYSSIGRDFEAFQDVLINYVKQNPSIGVAFNPGTFHIKAGLDSIRNFLSVTHILLLNKEEAQGLVGENPLEDLHQKLRGLGPKMTVITDGENGSSASDGNEFVQTPIFNREQTIVDKTGAGDAYSSGFLSAIYHNKPLKEAIVWGSINSSSVIRKVGAINGLNTKEELENLLNRS
ncbi:MAG: hypothetical protein UU80_C0023G0006 [candidate division WWE3 bacterium GW2011_GWA1_41_8]|uniref:Carbohydrate kinase PfkB domain-containing protein n=3 Tax=Katanobacteria TaxID=422282 RepID=A0A0G1A8N7_UNCKA|nr:MAG: hypothetical protein UU80_C0023G0006 [candidate division WWE3 bacterium GW2011_GWA1_41_8]OGC57524.1 MAG: hypothetical protein A2976_00090 [candidate division WWE3 bacterium RIFCSPLOWO2_01_FULL_41_9]